MFLDEYVQTNKPMAPIFNSMLYPKITINKVETELNISPFDEDIIEKILNHQEYESLFNNLYTFISNVKHHKSEFI